MGNAIQGVFSKVAIGKEAVAWGTEAASYLYAQFVSESLNENIEPMLLNVLGGSGQKPSEKGMQSTAGDLVVKADYYNALDVIFETALGSVSSGVYDFIDALTKSMSIKAEKADTGKIWKWLGCMVTSLKITGNAKENIVQVTATIAGKQVTIATGTVTETPTTESIILMSQDLFRIADRADALAAGDEIAISNFELTLDNNLKVDDVVAGQSTILQPMRNGFRKVTMSITVPRVTAETYALWQQNRTPLQADIYWSDGTKYMKIEIPYLICIDGGHTPIGGPELHPAELSFEAYLNSTAIMGDVDNEFRITLTDVV